MIETDSISQAWIEGLKLFKGGDLHRYRYDSRLGPCVEIENLFFRIRKPRHNEDLTRLYPRSLSSVIDGYVGSFLDPDNIENSTNSKRLYEWKKGIGNSESRSTDEKTLNQISRVVDRLRDAPNSRQNIASFWDPEIDWEHPNPVAPLLATFKARSYALHSTLIVRSVDAYLGTIPMFLGFVKLHDRIAREARIEPGSTSFFVWSYHVYEMDLPEIQDLIVRTDSLSAASASTE
jgi:thymidylate synthase